MKYLNILASMDSFVGEGILYDFVQLMIFIVSLAIFYFLFKKVLKFHDKEKCNFALLFLSFISSALLLLIIYNILAYYDFFYFEYWKYVECSFGGCSKYDYFLEHIVYWGWSEVIPNLFTIQILISFLLYLVYLIRHFFFKKTSKKDFIKCSIIYGILFVCSLILLINYI